MKSFRCEKCEKIFSVQDDEKVVCPKCKNDDVNTLYEIEQKDEEIISKDKLARKKDFIFHATLFGILGLIIVVLTVIIVVMNCTGYGGK